MKRISAAVAAAALLALSVAGPAVAAPNAGKGAKAQRDIVCTTTVVDGVTSQTCTNVSQVGTQDGATQTEVDAD